MDSWIKILALRGEILPGDGGLKIKDMSMDKNTKGKCNVMKLEDQGKNWKKRSLNCR